MTNVRWRSFGHELGVITKAYSRIRRSSEHGLGQFGAVFVVLLAVLVFSQIAEEVLFCEIDGRVLGGMQFWVLVELLCCKIDGQVLGVM